MPGIKIEKMTLKKHAELVAFWKNVEGIWTSDDDDYENLKAYLRRNPNLNFIATIDDRIVGTIKSGHDGRRGYIHHLAVGEDYRHQGIAKKLLELCLANLRKQKITKYRLFVFDKNAEGLEFWKHVGFTEKVYDYRTFEKNV
ncbi:MAG TPA: GNAT family N-acetyltransferase [Candidatus Lokiarchaeia archaeon]|nr:GNAT family N-acetyltransferase [Candidatus Lokiarchaeia archaeon]